MNLRVLRSKEILYPQNLFMDITEAKPEAKALEGLLYAVEKLEADERELISLRYVEKLSVKSVAERLGRDRAAVMSDLSAVLRKLGSPMYFNYVTVGITQWDRIAALEPAERMRAIALMEGKPVKELDASYLGLPRSVYSALNRSHTFSAPYTAADAARCVFGKPRSSLIIESEGRAAEEILISCGFFHEAEKKKYTRHGAGISKIGYPLNLYRCIFGNSCPEPDSDMVNGLAIALSEIPELGRQVIALLFEKGISYKKTAEELSVPPELVRQHETRALRYLRRSGVRHTLRYGAERAELLNSLRGNRAKAMQAPLSRLMTAHAAAELEAMGIHTVAEAAGADPSCCSQITAYELNDILSYLGI